MQFSFFLENEKATHFFAQDFSLALRKGDLITLEGDLGAGKSTFARAIIRTLANDMMLDVPSPTFTLVQNYALERFHITHADLYRIFYPEEIDELGFEEARQDGILLVEWPQKAEGALKDIDFSVTFSHEKKGRQIEIEAHDSAAKRLQHSLDIRNFLEKNGRRYYSRRFFTGDASARFYEILIADHNDDTVCDDHSSTPHTEVLMDAPQMEMPEISPVQTGENYAKKAHLSETIYQFIGIDRLILNHGFVAPTIHAYDGENGLLIMNDLGREGILDTNCQPLLDRYIASAELLAHFHQKDWPNAVSFSDFSFQIPSYDRTVLQVEVSLLLDWYVPFKMHQRFYDEQRVEFFAQWSPFFDFFEKAEQTFVMRDFHSPNILWREGENKLNRLGLLDFQDGQIGATAYDVVSLAQDARVALSPEFEKKVVAAYCTERKKLPRFFDEDAFHKIYAIAGAQRSSKILGLFIRLNDRDHKPQYLKLLPHCQDYLKRNLSHPELYNLREFYRVTGLIDG
ncbi:bifunctional tRNA (adenosine(37)-N6)-threonylcarbamoyltransferase complex ATPase subunit type 1 TsaE/phosphotransferase [Bartonella tamiae]|uniref:tRNA threonylcarbamoyladenosine biosynthesis protein TsaE n=1 Tax=Bartonella tamiae Th239 TaxID=1094558 RepID=J1K1Z7_9HYPH|nr:bifunctional tRNA (adenosine(37)-N6)-threonylcarbamoyltransferase complex ATPase subunit type 1 TsaE/phosphotransferase [Bartonella tamiae]EJF91110.1 YjeE family ATPase [Bartonella tamiae Th239]